MTLEETVEYFRGMVEGCGALELCPCFKDHMEMTKIALSALEKADENQKAEIERLKRILAEEEEKYKLCAKRFYKVGVKDFAEKLKSTYFIDSERLCCQVDKVFKEMVGDTE